MEKEFTNKYRHEFKYPISIEEANVICRRLSSLLNLDVHAQKDRKYNISSLYFDDIYNTAYYENENGNDPREKFRIRIYNHSRDVISLECKRKERGKTLKESCKISYEQVQQILEGETVEADENSQRLMRKFGILQRERKLSPIVIVEYERIPFVYILGNVRITIDMNLSASNQLKDFFESAKISRPVMPNGMVLLEVKYDDFLPDYIYRALSLDSLTQTAFSKYYLCRKYSLSGGLGNVLS